MLSPSALLPLIVALPFIAALVILMLGRALGGRAGWVLLVAAVASTAGLLRVSGSGAPLEFAVRWMPALNVRFALRGDPFGVFLALLVAGIGVLVTLYSLGYMAGEPRARLSRYYAMLAAFMGAMLGIALADDLILLFVFWEITSVTSFLLIGYRSEEETARAGAMTALLVTALGGLAMSVGFILVGIASGTFSLSALASDPTLAGAVVRSPVGNAALLLILCGAFTKSAQVPFHFWLPRAMVAPTPISAYLHAATMVKAGVFLLGRMLPIFGDAPLWTPVLVTVGCVSMLLGAVQALVESDLKAILARTTAATLGFITLLYGLGAAEQDALQIMNHALYKGALFLVAGIVEHHAHTRNIDELGGLRRALPLAFAAAVLAAASMAGLPPLLGFVAKESFYGTVLHSAPLGSGLGRVLVLAACMVANACAAAIAWMFIARVFLGQPRRTATAHQPHAPVPLWIAPVVLAAGTLALGVLAATTTTGNLVAALASRGREHLHVSLVPRLDAALGASLLAFALAVPLYRGRDRLRRWLSVPISSEAVWDGFVSGIARVAEVVSRGWQNGSLHRYLAVTALSVPALSWYALHRAGLSYRDIQISLADTPWYGVAFCVLLAAATVTAVTARTRLAAAIATTTIGYLVSMLFVVYRSPDILLTQVLIETVSTIFIVLVLIFLPAFPRQDLSARARAANFAIAAVFGATVTVLLLLSMTPGFREAVNIATRPGGLLSLSLAEGGGANAVNVIIVDIRAMDTNGEITVLVVVGLCIYGLLRSRRKTA